MYLFRCNELRAQSFSMLNRWLADDRGAVQAHCTDGVRAICILQFIYLNHNTMRRWFISLSRFDRVVSSFPINWWLVELLAGSICIARNAVHNISTYRCVNSGKVSHSNARAQVWRRRGGRGWWWVVISNNRQQNRILSCRNHRERGERGTARWRWQNKRQNNRNAWKFAMPLDATRNPCRMKNLLCISANDNNHARTISLCCPNRPRRFVAATTADASIYLVLH